MAAAPITPISRSADIARIEAMSADALRRVRALGIRIDIHEIRHADRNLR